MRDTLEGAGRVAVKDVWREAPPMAFMASLTRVFRPLPPLGRTIAAATTIAVVVLGIPVLLIAARTATG